MIGILTSPAFHIFLLLLYWVPFALVAYLVEIWAPERRRRSQSRLEQPIRHIPADRHMPAAAT